MKIDNLEKKVISSKIYKEATKIMTMPGIKLSEKEFELLSQNRSNIKQMIIDYTGLDVEEGFQEFLLRMYKEDPKQLDRFMPIGEPSTFYFLVRHFNDRFSGLKGGYHEWLECECMFYNFLCSDQYGKDVPYLILLMTSLSQRTDNVIFKNGGQHGNCQESSQFHIGLQKIIDSCSSAVELLTKINEYAQDVLTEESYADFTNRINYCLS